MAIIRLGPLVGGISGKVGSVVFANARSGALVRPCGVRTGQASRALTFAQGNTGRIAAAWNALTDAQRAAWNTAAAARPVPNRLGIVRQISGYQLYAQFAGDIYNGSPPASLAPPGQSLIYAPTAIYANFLDGGPWVLTSRGIPWPTSTPTEFAFVQNTRRATQVSGFTRARRISSWTKAAGSRDIYAAALAQGVYLWDGARYAAGVAWQVGGGYLGQRVFAVGAVGSVPWTVADFEDNSLTPWTTIAGTWSISTAASHGGARSLLCAIPAGPVVDGRIVSTSGLNLYPVRGHVFEYWAQWPANANSVRCWFGYTDQNNLYSAGFASGGNLFMAKILAGVTSTVAIVACPALTAGNWYRVVVSWGYAGTMSLTLFDSGGTQLATASGSDSSFDRGGFGFRTLNLNTFAINAYFDDVKVTGRAS